MTPSVSGAVVSAAISSEFKRLARVAVRNFREMPQRIFIGGNFHVAEAAFLVGQRALQKRKQFFFAQRAQFKNLRARNERRIDEEKRIVRRRADELDDAAFNVRQQNILLRFVEAMNFVNEQNRRLAGVFQAVGGGGQNAAHVGDVGFHAAQALEFAFGLARDDLRERGFAGAGRPVKNQRLNAVGFDGAAQQLSRRENMRLAGVFIQVARAHPRGERLAAEIIPVRAQIFLPAVFQPERKTNRHAP